MLHPTGPRDNDTRLVWGQTRFTWRHPGNDPIHQPLCFNRRINAGTSFCFSLHLRILFMHHHQRIWKFTSRIACVHTHTSKITISHWKTCPLDKIRFLIENMDTRENVVPYWENVHRMHAYRLYRCKTASTCCHSLIALPSWLSDPFSSGKYLVTWYSWMVAIQNLWGIWQSAAFISLECEGNMAGCSAHNTGQRSVPEMQTKYCGTDVPNFHLSHV